MFFNDVVYACIFTQREIIGSKAIRIFESEVIKIYASPFMTGCNSYTYVGLNEFIARPIITKHYSQPFLFGWEHACSK